jgi:hypothetical protein
LNARLHALIPNNPVAYAHSQIVSDLSDAIARAEAEYNEKLAPPPDVLKRALYVVDRKRTEDEPDSITYVLKQYKFFGFQVCVGWRVVAHPLGGGPPDAYYAYGSCSGTEFAPPWANGSPTPGPSPAVPPAASASPAPQRR